MMHRKVRRLLYEYGRGELDPVDMKNVEDHLARCNSCYAEYQIMKEAVRLIPSPAKPPSASRSEEYWARFASSVEVRTKEGVRKQLTTNPAVESLLSLLVYRRWAVTAATGVAVVVLAALFALSRGVFQPDYAEELAGAGVVTTADPVRMELAEYYRKSKILLVGISNINPELGQSVDLAVERQVARQLVYQTRYLDSKQLDERSRALVRALERILIELANMEQQADLKDVDIIRAGIHQENMLFKIRMAESDYATAENNRMSVEN